VNERRGGLRILFLSRWFPYPADNGSRIRIINLIRRLSARHQVHLISFSSERVPPEHLAMMRQYCARVDVVPYEPFRPRGLKALAGYFSLRPRSVLATYSAQLQSCVKQVARASSIDLVIASQIDMALYPLALPGVPRLLEELEVTTVYDEYARQSAPLQRARGRLTWWKLSRYVAELLPAYQGCTAVSQLECERIRSAVPSYDRLAVIPNGIDVCGLPRDLGAPAPDTLVYAGALSFPPNFRAIEFFLREVFPLIRARRPNVRLLVTGRSDPATRARLPAADGVVFTGYLDDVRPTIAGAWLSIVPLREGAGTRLKVLESLALGTPVVATRKGAEGLDLCPGRDLLIADEPADFAAAVLRVLCDEELRQTLGQSGRQTVAAKYDWRMIGRDFCELVETVAGGQRGPR